MILTVLTLSGSGGGKCTSEGSACNDVASFSSSVALLFLLNGLQGRLVTIIPVYNFDCPYVLVYFSVQFWT